MENDFYLRCCCCFFTVNILKQRLSNGRMPICLEFKVHRMRWMIKSILTYITFMCFIVVLVYAIVGRVRFRCPADRTAEKKNYFDYICTVTHTWKSKWKSKSTSEMKWKKNQKGRAYAHTHLHFSYWHIAEAKSNGTQEKFNWKSKTVMLLSACI